MNKLKSGIYKITINDYYIYIGQSVDVNSRWNGHLNELKQNKHYNKKLQNVFNKYQDKIKFEIIEECDVNKLDEREMYWIDYYRTFNTNHGLNMSVGGDSGHRKYRTRKEAEVAALEKRKEYYKVHKKEISEYHKQYYDDNIEKLKVKSKQWHINNKDYFKQYSKTHEKELKVKSKQYYDDNKEKLREYSKQWHINNKDEIKQYYKQYHQDNKERIRQQYRQWYQENNDKILAKRKHYRRQKGILSCKEKFEKRYNLSRPLTNKEWDTWCNTKNKGKPYAIKFLQSLPNLTFTIPPKK